MDRVHLELYISSNLLMVNYYMKFITTFGHTICSYWVCGKDRRIGEAAKKVIFQWPGLATNKKELYLKPKRNCQKIVATKLEGGGRATKIITFFAASLIRVLKADADVGPGIINTWDVVQMYCITIINLDMESYMWQTQRESRAWLYSAVTQI